MADAVVTCPKCSTRNRVPAAAAGTLRCPSCKTSLPWIVDATDADFDAVADSSKVPVLVDLWAAWCGPCRQVSPALEQLARERAGALKLVKVDIDQSPRTSTRFGVQAVPTLLLFDRGVQVSVQRGAAPLAALRDWVDRSLPGR
ncbi:MAG: thioredoxin [Actinomycetales bacterium]|nr:MAG: thioredoxin [Actinomycetales bacterium]